MDYHKLRNHEFQTTLRVLKAYPEDKVDMKPANKSRTAGELAMTFANEERVVKTLIETGATNPGTGRMGLPSGMAAIIAAWHFAPTELGVQSDFLTINIASLRDSRP